MNLLVAARDFCRESPFCFTSTNKVYGDRPNYLPLVEKEKRWDYADGLDGIDENMSIDQCLHSIFGASKVAADVMCQEFGRYFSMPIGVFRSGCHDRPATRGRGTARLPRLHRALRNDRPRVHHLRLQGQAGTRSDSRARRGEPVPALLSQSAPGQKSTTSAADAATASRSSKRSTSSRTWVTG